ncbi:MAG: MSMEG_1061 family FMN-dependent PPOX-type flavoprotein [Hasllibacter sp.]
MEFVRTIEELEAHNGAPREAALMKVADRITPLYRRWIGAARFCVLTTVGPEGTDGSPRGDEGPVVRIADERTLILPDWRGNDRIDSLRNVVRDGRVSLMFMVPGSDNVVRVNGTGRIAVDAALLSSFERAGRRPRSAVVIAVGEVYSQCARALIRSRLWTAGDEGEGLPTVGELLSEAKAGFDGAAYDAAWAARARGTMW